MKRYLIPLLLVASAAYAQPPHPMPPPVADQSAPERGLHPHADIAAMQSHQVEAAMLLWQREIKEHEADIATALQLQQELQAARAKIADLEAAAKSK